MIRKRIEYWSYAIVFAMVVIMTACTARGVTPTPTTQEQLQSIQSSAPAATPSCRKCPFVIKANSSFASSALPSATKSDSTDDLCTAPYGTCIIEGEAQPTFALTWAWQGNSSSPTTGDTYTCTVQSWSGTGMTGNFQPATTTVPSPAPPEYACNEYVQIAQSVVIGTYQSYTWQILVYNPQGKLIDAGSFDTIDASYTPVSQRSDIQAVCSNDLNACPTLDVTDTDLNKVVSGTPPPSPTDWIVGLQKNLSAAIRAGSGSGSYPTVVSTSWTKPAHAVASYNFGANKTTAPAALTMLSSPTLQFYWDAGNNTNPDKFKVTQQVVRSDGQETATVTTSLSYLVLTPSDVVLGVSYSPTQYGVYNSSGNKAVSSGTQLNLPTSAGIDTAFTATAPNAIPGYAGGGYFAASQILVSSTPAPGPTPPVADGCAIFSANGSPQPNPVVKIGAGANVNWSALDAPAQFTLPAPGQAFTYGDSFVDYFIYRPTGKQAIWVALGTLSWGWGATITNNSGTYALTNVTNSNQATTSASTTEPKWNSIFNPGDATCASLPTQ